MASKFAKIKPNIWRTKLVDLSPNAKLTGIYFMTNDRFQMIGIYYIPTVDIVIGTGLTESEIDSAMTELEQAGFCCYDRDDMFVWVIDMAASQVADNPSETQKKGVANELCRLYEDDESSFVEPFLEKYHSKFDLPESPDDLLDYNFKN